MVKLTADVAADQANAIIATNGFCSARRFVQRLAFFIIVQLLRNFFRITPLKIPRIGVPINRRKGLVV